MYRQKELCAFIDECPDEAHFVLLSEPEIKKATYPWSDTHPSKEEVKEHLEADPTNRVGLIPSSIGCGVLDFDGNDPQKLAMLSFSLKPRASVPSNSGGLHTHMWVRLSDADLAQYSENKSFSYGDWRCSNGYVVLWPGCEDYMPDVLRGSATDSRNLQELLKKKTVPQKKKTNKDSKKYIPNGLDAAAEVQWMLETLGVRCEFNRLRNKFFLNGEPAEEHYMSHLRMVSNHRFKRKYVVSGELIIKPINLGRDAWKDCLRAIMHRTNCDPLGDWMRAQTHPDIQTVEDAEAYAKLWFHEVFDVRGGRTELSEYLSKLIILGPVARRRYPGIIIKHYPVIAGPSNCGKTALVENMLPPEYSDYAQPRLNLKKSADELIYDVAGMGVVELNEMGNTKRAEASHIKGWLSEGHYKGRLKYAEHSTSLPFTHFIIGTANLDDAPLPSDPVAAQRFFVQEVLKKPHDPTTENGIVEDYMDKNRVKMYAAANMILDSWEVSDDPMRNRKVIQHKLRTVPHHLRSSHEARAEEYSFDPNTEIEMVVWEWLIGVEGIGGYTAPVAPKRTPEGVQCWGLSDISIAVPEFGKIKSTTTKAKVLKKIGFIKLRLTSGIWRNLNVYIMSDPLIERLRLARSQNMRQNRGELES